MEALIAPRRRDRRACAIFDVAALLLGADSRDGFTDDCLRTTLS